MTINERLFGEAVEVPLDNNGKTETMIFQGLCETRSLYTAAICENKEGKICFFPLDNIRFLDTEDVRTEIMHYTMVKIPEECFNSDLINCDGIFNNNAKEVKIVSSNRILYCGYKDYGIDGTMAEYEFIVRDEDNIPYRCGDLYWEEKTDET